jgi:hypothetical protein
MATTFARLKVKPQKKKQMDRKVAQSSVDLLIDFRAMRAHKGLTLRDCVAPSGMSHPTLYRIEIGAEPSLSNALLFSKFLGIPIEKIWEVRKRGQ